MLISCVKSFNHGIYSDFSSWQLIFGVTIQKKYISSSIAVSPDSGKILTGYKNGTLCLWEAGNGELIKIIKAHNDAAGAAAFSPDGKIFASGSRDGTLKLWETDTGELVRVLKEDDWVNSVSFSSDGKYIVAGSGQWCNPGSVKLWDIESGAVICKFNDDMPGINAASLSFCGKRIICGAHDGIIRLWDIDCEKIIRRFTNDSPVCSAAFSGDGTRLLSGTIYGFIKLYDVDTGLLIRAYGEEEMEINAASFSPDGRHIVSAAEGDGCVKFWNTESGQLVNSFKAQTNFNNISSVIFSPNGKYIAFSYKNSLRIWGEGK